MLTNDSYQIELLGSDSYTWKPFNLCKYTSPNSNKNKVTYKLFAWKKVY